MKEIVKNISLDLSRKSTARVYFANQTEYNSRRFRISLFDDGVPYPVDKKMTSMVNILRPDGTSWSYYSDTEEDGTVCFTAPLWAFEIAGDTSFTVSLYDELQKITSSAFVVEVLPDTVNENHINEVAENLTLFQQTMEKVGEIMSAEAVRVEEENTRNLNEAIRKNAEDDRISKELIRNEKEQERCQNEEQRMFVLDSMKTSLQNLLNLQQIYIEKGETGK